MEKPSPPKAPSADTDVTGLRAWSDGSRIVEMRFLGGLTMEEIGEVLKVSTGTITRDWRAAKAWLSQELTR